MAFAAVEYAPILKHLNLKKGKEQNGLQGKEMAHDSTEIEGREQTVSSKFMQVRPGQHI